MRKTIIFLVLNLIFAGITFGQTAAERGKAISIVENLYYNEYYLGTKCYDKIEISSDEAYDRIEIYETNFMGKDQHLKTKTSFYLNDMDLATMKYDLSETEPDLYFVIVQLDAKGKSIEINSVNTYIDKFPYPVSDLEYRDKLHLSPMKSLPKRLAEKFVENIKIMLGAESYIKASIFK